MLKQWLDFTHRLTACLLCVFSVCVTVCSEADTLKHVRLHFLYDRQLPDNKRVFDDAMGSII